MVQCLDCNGTGKIHGIACYRADEVGPGYSKPMTQPCFHCHGAGEVDEVQVEWTAIGERVSQDRMAHGVSLRERARMLSLPAHSLSDVEHGKVDPEDVHMMLGLPLRRQLSQGFGSRRLELHRQIHCAPTVAIVAPGVLRAPAQDEHVATAAGVQHPLGHVHGKLAHRLDLGVGFTVVQDHPEIGCPAVEKNRLVFPRNAPPVEVRRPPCLQLAAEGDAAVLGDDGDLFRTQRAVMIGIRWCRGSGRSPPYPVAGVTVVSELGFPGREQTLVLLGLRQQHLHTRHGLIQTTSRTARQNANQSI